MADVQHAAQTGADLHEPKGIASATVGSVLIADGAASGAWKDLNAYAEIVLDLTGTLTRSFVGATAYTDLILDYIAEHTRLFSYNDTTKELTYNGTETIVAQLSLTFSIKRTDIGGAPEMTVAMFHDDDGLGFDEIPSSRVARSFGGADVGSMAITGLHTMSTGDLFKLQVKTDAGMDIELRNLNWSVHFIGLV